MMFENVAYYFLAAVTLTSGPSDIKSCTEHFS